MKVVNMKVVNIIDGNPLIQEVPDDWIRCLVSGEFRPQDEFVTDGRWRTNCKRTYELPTVDMHNLSAETKLVKNSEEFKKLQSFLQKEKAFEQNSISVKEMIKHLQSLPEGSRLIMTQEGYYADGKFANIFVPEPKEQVNGVQYYTIGHSSQNY